MKAEEFADTSSRLIPEKQFQQLLEESEQRNRIAGKLINLSSFIKDFFQGRLGSMEELQHFAESRHQNLTWTYIPGTDNKKILIELTDKPAPVKT